MQRRLGRSDRAFGAQNTHNGLETLKMIINFNARKKFRSELRLKDLNLWSHQSSLDHLKELFDAHSRNFNNEKDLFLNGVSVLALCVQYAAAYIHNEGGYPEDVQGRLVVHNECLMNRDPVADMKFLNRIVEMINNYSAKKLIVVNFFDFF